VKPARIIDLPPPGRLFVAACRAGAADLKDGAAWQDGELLALCDAAGLRRCAAARLGACVAFLILEASARPFLLSPGDPALSDDEATLAVAVTAAAAKGSNWREVAAWLPARRRMQGLTLLALVNQDLATWPAGVA
jgi:hypothetical protein